MMSYNKYIYYFFGMVLLLQFADNAPVVKSQYRTLSIIQNCPFPIWISVPNIDTINDEFYHSHLPACFNISEVENQPVEFLLCHEIDKMLSRILCNDQIDSNHTTVTVPFPEENDVCHSFLKINGTIFSKDKTNVFCEVICKSNAEMCRFLLWVYQMNDLLGGKIPLNYKSTISHNIQNNITTVSAIDLKNNSIAKESIKKESVTQIHTSDILINKTQNTNAQFVTNLYHPDINALTHVEDNKSLYIVTSNHNNDYETTTITVQVSENTTISRSYKPDIVKNKTENNTDTQQTDTYSLSVTQHVKNSELSSLVSYKSEFEETDANDDENLLEGDIQENTIFSSKTTEIISSKKYPGDELQEEGHVKENSDAPGISITRYDKDMPVAFMEPEDSHFFIYFVFVVGVVIGCYILFHNKQKIIALIIEGRHERRRRPNGGNYRKLETK